MRIIRTAAQINQLLRVQAAIRQAERKFVKPKIAQSLKPKDLVHFETNGPNGAAYGATQLFPFIEHLEELAPSPDLRFADLGSGLGASSFAAVFHFREVVGYEFDSKLVAEANMIRDSFEWQHQITFKNEDFLTADLQGFSVVYAYHPFNDNFVGLIAERLRNLAPGTIIISQFFNFLRPQIFSTNHFEQLLPKPTDEAIDQYSYQTEFYTYRRV